ncbi:hypothetical protein LWX53_11820 [bacterium]|nr:hypothetical protein [bacterium]
MFRLKKSAARGAAYALLISVLAASCSLDCLFVHDIILAAPGRPRPWRGAHALRYRVAWRDAEGFARSALVGEGEEIALRLKRGAPQAILAEPLWEGQRLFPAGALYPRDLEAPPGDLPSLDPDRMALSFASGYAAAVAAIMEEKGVDPWGFPIEKLASVPVGAGKDPWDLPPWKAADAILGGTFRASAFPAARAAFALPDGAEWLPESPFCAFGDEGGGRISSLADGLHLFFAEGLTLAVRVEGGRARLPAALFKR